MARSSFDSKFGYDTQIMWRSTYDALSEQETHVMCMQEKREDHD